MDSLVIFLIMAVTILLPLLVIVILLVGIKMLIKQYRRRATFMGKLATTIIGFIFTLALVILAESLSVSFLTSAFKSFGHTAENQPSDLPPVVLTEEEESYKEALSLKINSIRTEIMMLKANLGTVAEPNELVRSKNLLKSQQRIDELEQLLKTLTSKPSDKAEKYQTDVSTEAYEKAIIEFDRLKLPRQSYEDWRLFREQNKLHNLYLDLLDIDPKEAMLEFDKHAAEYQKAYELYKHQRGMTNETALDDFEQDFALLIEFQKQFNPTHTNHAAAIMIVWEAWGEFKEAESFFRKRMISANVQPKDAYDALWLSSQQRRAIGQWEQSWEQSVGESTSNRRSNDYSRTFAVQLLTSFKPNKKTTPFSHKLMQRAEEEIHKSETAEDNKNFGSAHQWARDAIETAQSAKALYELEINNLKSSKPSETKAVE